MNLPPDNHNDRASRQLPLSQELQRALNDLIKTPPPVPARRTPIRVAAFEFPWRLAGGLVAVLGVAGVCFVGWMILIQAERCLGPGRQAPDGAVATGSAVGLRAGWWA